MLKTKYLIVGGGMTADAAVKALREADPDGQVVMVSAEADPPYTRPLLSKGLWLGKPFEKVWRGTDSAGIDLRLNCRIAHLDPGAKTARDDRGEEYAYESALLATGGVVRRLPFGGEDIIYYRTLEDYRRLRALADQRQRFVVIGGGFIGTEIAAALASNGKRVTVVHPGRALGQNVYPPALAEFITFYYGEKGVEVLSGASATNVQKEGEGYTVQVRLADGRDRALPADGVVAGIGIQPDTALARQAGISCENGVVVSEFLETTAPGVFAAGDVAAFPSAALKTRVRVEHEDNALTMGKTAGRIMGGQREPYLHLPYFYSDLFELGYEAVGDLNPELTTIADWEDRFRKGVVFYTLEGRIRGVLLWNVWDKVPAARRLIESGRTFREEELKARLLD
ncbi:MAG TPA: FAD-dependent oxidoreductase [Anaerolineales bacterium]|nr:FAD-dependent oxidoreductase [Anaerolineales bacterium]